MRDRRFHGENKESHSISSNVLSVLTCPYCGNPLASTENGVECPECQQEYSYSSRGQLDLRLKRKKVYPLQVELGTDLLSAQGSTFEILQENTSSLVDFSKINASERLSKVLMSYFPRAKGDDSLVLDLGCGNAIHKEACEKAGFEYVGIDLSPEAPIIADAHALPFRENSFEFILSVNVLEHIQYPLVMMAEAYRVLRASGVFIGTVAFLEPFHSDSYYHHTHLGVLNSLKSAGFDVKQIAPNTGWSVLEAQAVMGLFPKMPRSISRLLVFPLYIAHRSWWKAGYLITRLYKASEHYRVLSMAGSFSFVASKKE